MWRMFSLMVVVWVVCFLAVSASAQTLLKVNETETQAVFQTNQLQTNLVLENQSANFAGKARLEILDADDRVLASSETSHAVRRGRQTLPVVLNFTQAQTSDNLLWYRLRYAVALENSSLSTSGIVSLSEIMPELFELQISAPENVYAGMRVRAHVLALHSMTKKPIKNVAVTGEISLDLDTEADEDELKITAKGKTDDEGFTTLDFEIPSNANLDSDGEITIKGEKRGITREASEDLDVSADSRVYLNLDKPIYQPNQKLFARALYLNPARRPMAEKEIEFEISDEAGETVYEGSVKTSRFGVAALSWQIPADAKLGKYRIEIENDGGDRIGRSEFKVTRYDLPNFSVSAKADRAFYLPEQKTAEITVSADYLFGKPVASGRARVVRETERTWNYRQQKWEIEEAKSYEVAPDAEGKFVARVDLTEAQEDLQNEGWKRFEDLHFVAYFTDASTNRTEQKRFDVRLSKEAIHLYLIGSGGDVNPKLPYQFYISTFYADGTAARCDIEVKGNYRQAPGEKILAATKTNSYGAGKVEIRLPEKPFPAAENQFDLQISARDRQGNIGILTDNFYLDENEKQIRVKTDKTIYLPNENIEAKLFSSEDNETVMVDVLKNSSVVYSKRVKLGDGRATVQIPFRPDFKGELTILAYFKSEDRYDQLVAHSKNVVYPSPSDLKLNIKSLKSVYRPNEEAKISFSARGAAGGAAETALGVVILDKAIEERAQTERMPDNYSDLRRLAGTLETFGNLTRRDLNNLDLNKPLDADLQLAAEFLLVNQTYKPHFFESDSYRQNFAETFQNYFANKLQPFENALRAHYEKTGEYPANETDLRRILSANGINFDELRDAWGTAYAAEFKIDRNVVAVALKTASGDKKFGTADDFRAREVRFEWFAKTQHALNTFLNNYTQQTKKIPWTIDELKAIWKQAGFDVEALRDGWNRPLYLTFMRYERGTQKTYLENVGNLDGATQQVIRGKTVLQDVLLFKLRSAGADAVQDNYDDFDLGAFSVVAAEKDLSSQPEAGKISKIKTANATGAIAGTLFDPNGAVVPGFIVTAVNQSSQEVFSRPANENGEFLIANLPSGKYSVSAGGESGFMKTTIENVVVSSMSLIQMEIWLSVAAASATVSVTDSSATIDTTQNTSSTVSKTEVKSISGVLSASGGAQTSTPRVREYFPETLVWQPELITDKMGRAELKFTLADNLTTWKLYAFGSTEAGEVALVEKQMQTFQPFFAELEPPKILTEGDEIALPVPVRNYTDKRQKVSVSMTENDWSSLLNGATQQIEIAPNNSQNAIFNFRAAAPVKEGRQKVTALAAKGEGDAIEKPVTVKPNGKEIVRTQSQLFRDNAAFEVNFPASAFPNTRRAELKIYPNMLAHVAESVEGLLKRPYGCGEQTTSSTYPNLMILKIEKDLGKAIDAKTKTQAYVYLKEGYERLLNYQTPSGGFSYWGKTDAPNVALTAYVLRFLRDAKGFIEVDEKVIENAQSWLLKQQKADGSWQPNYGDVDSLTAYVARLLAMHAGKNEEAKKSLGAGLEFLKKRLPEIKNAHVLANFALSAIASNDAETAQTIAEKLNSLPQAAKESLFWTTDQTPFYGWGTTAQIETTALVMQVFLRLNENNKYAANLSGGLLFLLKNKDRYGVWYSTQTTVNVLDALILLQKSNGDSKQNANEKAEIYLNGRKIQDFSVDLNSFSSPLFIDVSSYLTEPANRLEIKNGGANFIQAQIVAAHYLPWKDVLAEDSPHFDLRVNFDKTETKIGDEINCAVTIARKTSHYGMILAEIGIPPGADVDRGSLENAKKQDENISRYDVLPDKIIVYLWSGSRPANFNFKFKPRYGINAQNAPSTVYDYYNEEARTTLAPVRFVVK